MRRALLLLTLFTPLLALAQAPVITQEVVNGTLQLPPGTPASNTTVRFQLVYCGGNSGRVTNPDGSITIVSFAPYDLRTTNGTWSTNLYGSDQIMCGTAIGSSRWRMTPIFNGINGPSLDYQVNSCGGFTPPKPNGCTFDVDAAPQCGSTVGGVVATTNCVVEYPYVVPPPEPIQGPPGPPGPAGPPGPPGVASNPGALGQIAYYAGPGTTTTVSPNTRLTEDSTLTPATLSYLGNTYTQGTDTIDSVLYVNGAWYMDTVAAAMSAAPAGRSAMGVGVDGNFYISANATAPSEICTVANGVCGSGGGTGTVPGANRILLASNGSGSMVASGVSAGVGFLQGLVLTASGAGTGTSPFNQPNASVEYFPLGAYGFGSTNGLAAYFSHSGSIAGSSGNGGIALGGGNATGAGYQVYLDCEMTGCDFKVPLTTNGTSPVPNSVLYPAHFAMYPVLGQPQPQLVGLGGSGTAAIQSGGSANDITPTPANGLGHHYVSSITASTTTGVGTVAGQSAGNSVNVPYVSFTRYSTRLALWALTNCRYYFGLSTYNTTGLGGNTLSVLSSAKFTSDTPNTNFIGFRYSNGTDTTYKAVTISAGGSFGSQTVNDTHITADTNPHLFEIYPASNNTVMNFYIDKVLVTSISTTLPPVTPSSVADGFASPFFTGDNKNTATFVGVDFYSMEVSLKLP